MYTDVGQAPSKSASSSEHDRRSSDSAGWLEGGSEASGNSNLIKGQLHASPGPSELWSESSMGALPHHHPPCCPGPPAQRFCSSRMHAAVMPGTCLRPRAAREATFARLSSLCSHAMCGQPGQLPLSHRACWGAMEHVPRPPWAPRGTRRPLIPLHASFLPVLMPHVSSAFMQ